MVVTAFRTGAGGGVGVLEEEPELEDEVEDELEDEDEVEVVVGVVAATEGAKVETVSSPLLTTKTLLEDEVRSAYAGMRPTLDCEIAASPETSMVVLAPACAVPFWLMTMATLLKFGFGRVGMIGVATGR
jgi:hypothetical protein